MIRRSALAALIVAATSCVASAADWVERPYNPPVGSRWILESKSSSDERREGGSRTMNTTMRGELTIDSKTADGFKITYVGRSAVIDGNSPNVALLREMTDIMNGVVIRAQTNDAGRPVKLDNLEEVRAVMRQVIGRRKARFADKPAAGEAIEKLLNGMLMVDEARAAELYIDNAILLVMGQKTGLKVGELRRFVEEQPSPIGGGTIKSNVAFQIVNADPTTGKVNYLRTTAFDVPSVKELTIRLTRQIMTAATQKSPGDIDKLEKMLREMDVSMTGRTEIEVENGMTRRVRDQSEMRASVVGQTASKIETKTVTVTPAP
jgi:hypothetical protein